MESYLFDSDSQPEVVKHLEAFNPCRVDYPFRTIMCPLSLTGVANRTLGSMIDYFLGQQRRYQQEVPLKENNTGYRQSTLNSAEYIMEEFTNFYIFQPAIVVTLRAYSEVIMDIATRMAPLLLTALLVATDLLYVAVIVLSFRAFNVCMIEYVRRNIFTFKLIQPTVLHTNSRMFYRFKLSTSL